MTTNVLLVVLVLLSASSLALGLAMGRRPLLRARARKSVVVTMKSGSAWQGVLWETDRDVWVLRNVVSIGGGDADTNIPVDGEILLPAGEVEFMQKP